MAGRADIGFSLGLDTVSFQKGLVAAQKNAEAAAKAMQGVLLKAAGVLGVAFGVDKFAGMIAGVVESGKQLDALSRETGIATGDITLMTKALDRSGQSAESTAGILETLRDNVRFAEAGFGDAAKGMAVLGVSADELKGKGLNEQFSLLATRVNGIKDPIIRAAIATQIFGSNGAKAVASFESTDLERASKLFGASSKGMADAAPALARASEAFTRIQSSGKAFMEIMIARLAPFFERAAKMAEDLIPQIEEMAKSFSDKISYAITILTEAFKKGKLDDLLFLSLKVGLMKAADFAIGVSKGVTNALMELLGQTLSVLFGGDIWFAFSDGMIGAFKVAANTGAKIFLDAFETPLKALQDGLTFIFLDAVRGFKVAYNTIVDLMRKIPGFEKTEKFKFGKRESFEDFQKSQKGTKASFFGLDQAELSKNVTQGSEQIKRAGTEFRNALTKGGASGDAIIRAFQDGMKGAGIFGPKADAAMAELQKLMDNLLKGAKPFTEGDDASRPGGGPGGAPKRLLDTTFDAFRKVGGGIGGAATGIAERSLDVQRSMDDKLGKLIQLTSGGARLTGSTGAQFTFAHP